MLWENFRSDDAPFATGTENCGCWPSWLRFASLLLKAFSKIHAAYPMALFASPGQDSRERRVSDEMMDDEVMDSEQAKLVEELRTQLDRLADTKHELMLNLKRVLNSESEAALSGSHDRPKPPEEPGPDSTSQQGLLHPSTSAAADIDSQSEISLEGNQAIRGLKIRLRKSFHVCSASFVSFSTTLKPL